MTLLTNESSRQRHIDADILIRVKRPKIKVTRAGNIKIVFGAYLCEKCINSSEAKTVMTNTPTQRFTQYNAAAKMRTFKARL